MAKKPARVKAFWYSRPKPYKAYWWNTKPNFGDELAPFLLTRFADLDVEWDTVSRSCIVSVGSILEHIPPLWDGYVLGSGKLYEDSRLYLYGEGTNVLALRGPLSKKSYAGDCAIGDPGLLANELVAPQARTIDLGIIPHWSDTTLAKDKRFFGDWSRKVIPTRGDPIDIIKQIGQCKKIVSSSLHGLIVADAFGIPRRFEYTKRFDSEGGLFKFRDYHQSIGMNFLVGETLTANPHNVETRQHELWDAYRDLGTILRSK
jgi:pyruvyltransferase